MRTIGFLLVIVAVLPLPASAHGLDAKTPLVCAVTDVFDCSAGECTEVVAETVNVPELFRLDPETKTLRALDMELSGAGSQLDSLSDEKGKLGARAHDGDRALVLVVDEESGEAFLTVTDLHLSLVAYGTCGKL